MSTIWHDLPKPFFVLAPMEAVTDVVFRHVVARASRPDLFMTEFTNAASYCSPKGAHSTRGRLAFTPDEQPIIAQIWGNNPDNFRQMSIGLRAAGYLGIDINMGCPAKNVVRKETGSGLIRNPALAAELIAAAKESGLPVSVKTRLGYSSVDEWRDWLTHILRQDIANLTIHLRTRKEMSKVDAHFELIPEIKKLRDEIAPQTLLTINGDIRDRTHGLELVEKYGIDGIMIGRGIFKNPYAFARSETLLPFSKKPVDSSIDESSRTPQASQSEPVESADWKNGSNVEPCIVKPSEKWDIRANLENTQTNLLELLNYHLDLHEKYSAELEPRAFEPLKRFFKVYLHSFPGAGELRAKLMQTKTVSEVREILANTTDVDDGEDPQHVDAPGDDQ